MLIGLGKMNRTNFLIFFFLFGVFGPLTLEAVMRNIIFLEKVLNFHVHVETNAFPIPTWNNMQYLGQSPF